MAQGIRVMRGAKSVPRQIDRILRSELMLVIFVFLLMSNCATTAKMGNRRRRSLENCPISKEITHCSCETALIGIGINIRCGSIDDIQFENTLDVLKNNSYRISYLRTRDADLTNIQNNSFLGVKIEHLSLIKSGISHVEPYAFTGLASTLDNLNLEFNDIEVVPTTALSTLKSLTILDLNNNKIEILNKRSFAGMTSLKKLLLYQNQIHRIHADAFKGMGNILTSMDLKWNHVNEIPPKTFHTLVNLKTLDLGFNKIEQILDGAFEGLKSLDRLLLQHNQITIIHQNVFKDLNMLTSLDLGNNRIKSVDVEAFTGLERNLIYLDLEHNSLDHIPAHALRDLVSMRSLALQDNIITAIEEHDFKGYGSTLQNIYLNNNRIKVIHEKAFKDLHSIKWLYLSSNMITTLTKNTVQSILDTIISFDVTYNPLKCGCDVRWINEGLNINENRFGHKQGYECVTTDGERHSFFDQKAFYCPKLTFSNKNELPNSTSNSVKGTNITKANEHSTSRNVILAASVTVSVSMTMTLAICGYKFAGPEITSKIASFFMQM